FRLKRHFLEERAARGDLLTVVGRTCGLHAQVMSSAELAAWARIDGLDSGDVRAALWQERTLVKTWGMRWTLHLFSTADYPVYLAAFRAFGHFRRERWLTSYGLTADDMNALLESFRVTLTGDGLTREQLADAVAQQAGRPYLRDKLLGGFGTLLKPGAYQGHLVFGPSRGQNVTFVSPRQWLGGFPELDTDDARLETVRRYLSAYGPATPGDFASWWGATRADSRKLFRALGDELIPVSVEGWDTWGLHADADALQSVKPSTAVRLLPGFDPYTVGLRREREAALSAEQKRRVFSQQGWISAVVLAGGYVVGVWKYQVKQAQLAVTVEPFAPLSRAIRDGIVLVADHNAYHIGEFAIMRQVMGTWGNAPH
ncbi:MAG TPA: winged helix DNA-binding domain-containing protein, partial [Ktedonobacterales bacterium]|nr:winged helix DNA-binding domain-containing protein [Ktedonobacterales bacterium]